MAAHTMDDLIEHMGHDLVIARYESGNITTNVAIECETCYSVLFELED
jgi:hypothetical protein